MATEKFGVVVGKVAGKRAAATSARRAPFAPEGTIDANMPTIVVGAKGKGKQTVPGRKAAVKKRAMESARKRARFAPEQPALFMHFGGDHKFKEKTTTAKIDFLQLYRTDPLVQINIIKGGVPARSVRNIAQRMRITSERLTSVLGVAQATVNRKAKAGTALDADDATRVLGMARLVGQVEQMVQESGNSEGFDAAQWVAQWIERPVPALGNRKPADLLDTTVGQEVVGRLVAQMQSGAYA